MRHISIEFDKDKKTCCVCVDGCEKYRTHEVDAEGSEGEEYRGFHIESRKAGEWVCPDDEAAYTEFSSAFKALADKVIAEACDKLG